MEFWEGGSSVVQILKSDCSSYRPPQDLRLMDKTKYNYINLQLEYGDYKC